MEMIMIVKKEKRNKEIYTIPCQELGDTTLPV